VPFHPGNEAEASNFMDSPVKAVSGIAVNSAFGPRARYLLEKVSGDR